MPHYTDTVYGTESISISLDTPTTKSHTCRTSKWVAWCLFAFLIVSFIVYTYHGQQTHLASSSKFKSIESSDSIIVENCENDEDMSCDAQYGCSSYEMDITKVFSGISTQWDEFSAYVEEKVDVSMDSDGCMESRFTESHVMCNDECDKLGYVMDSDAHARANVCKNTFLDEMQSVLKPYRRSCIAALLAHEFATLCGRKYEFANSIEKATFLWWKDRYSVAPTWTHQDCPYFI
eukprot:674143_1